MFLRYLFLPLTSCIKLLHVHYFGTEVFKRVCVEQSSFCRSLTRLSEGNMVNIFHPLADYKNGASCCCLASRGGGEQDHGC